MQDYARQNRLWLSGYARVAGIAQPGKLSDGISSVTTVATYLGTALNTTPDKIVQSIEAKASVAYQIAGFHVDGDAFALGKFDNTSGLTRPSTVVTLSLVASVGAITPAPFAQAQPLVFLLTQDVVTAFPSTPPSPTGCTTASITASCFFAFVPTDRSRFYREYDAGVRLKFYGADYDNHQLRFPGIADFTIGQNEYVTGGRLRKLVLHAGGMMPIPRIRGLNAFGSMDLALSRTLSDVYTQQFALSAPASKDITFQTPGVQQITVPQPNRDRYRIGFSFDVFELVDAIRKGKAK